MNIKATFHILGLLLIYLAIALLSPIPFSLLAKDNTWTSFLTSSGISFVVGLFLYLIFSKSEKLTHREGFGIVTIGWTAYAVIGGLPYFFTGVTPNIIDAFFESMSGFTTTGSTIITSLADVPKSILFWRSLTQWLGGMGIIVLSIAVLPFLGAGGGTQLFQAEVPGPTKDRFGPRIQDTAKVLWEIYFLFTFLEAILLMLGGVSFFDAICHSFTTMATGGFSTYDRSIAAFDSSYVHIVITFFMFMAGTNFAIHYRALKGKPLSYFKSEEFGVYSLLFLFVTIIFAFINLGRYTDSFWISFRDAAFQVVSIGTSTGYATADFERWPSFARFVLLLLMVIGSCAGSTGGGAKVIRIILMVKHSIYQIFHLIHPKGIKSVKINSRIVPEEVIQKTIGFCTLYFGIFLFSSVIMTFLGLDVISAISSVIACMSNIGPGLGSVGPVENFAHIPILGKIILTFCMLVGRLEIYTILILFFPSFWKKL